MNSSPFEKQKVGLLVIHEEQIVCAEKIMNVFKRCGGPPICVAQPQQGKTGVSIKVIDEFIKYCEASHYSYEALYLLHTSDNVLKDQTDDRICKSGLLSDVVLLQHSDLKKYEPKKVDLRLIIMDECHIALSKSTDGKLKPLHEFLKKCGINYGESIDTWENKNNYVLSVSATPFAHIIQSKIKEKSFEPITLDMNEKYYSIQQMVSDGRFFQSESVVKHSCVTIFLKEKLSDFKMFCQTNGNGHMIIRSCGDSPQIIENYIKKKYGKEMDVRVFDCKKKNIRSLDNILGTEPAKPFIAIIKGSLRAGKTLQTTKFIRMWIEPKNSKTDSMCQVVGRCLGFSGEADYHSKFDDKFPVYCNIKEIREILEFYNDPHHQCVPTGNNNSKTRHEKHEVNVMFFEFQEDVEKYLGKFIVSKCSENEVESIAMTINDKSIRGQAISGNKKRVYLMDAPSKNTEHFEDWEKFTTNYPDKVGWYFYLQSNGKIVDNEYENKIKPTVIFGENLENENS